MTDYTALENLIHRAAEASRALAKAEILSADAAATLAVAQQAEQGAQRKLHNYIRDLVKAKTDDLF